MHENTPESILDMTSGISEVKKNRSRKSFNKGWSFFRFGDQPDGTYLDEVSGGYSAPGYDDGTWRNLDLPHDWAIEGPFRIELDGGTGKLPHAGIGWYRKNFHISKSDQEKRVFIDFDGAMSESRVWLNGDYLGEWPYGYTSFRLELTPHLKYGEDNVLAVRLDNKALSSRWYPGGGIYRNVWLVKTEAVHVAHWGAFVTTPNVEEGQAGVNVQIAVDNQADGPSHDMIEVQSDIYRMGEEPTLAASTERASLQIAHGATGTCTLKAVVKQPALWDLEHRNLYCALTKIYVGGEVVDSYPTSFGIRTINIDAEKGLTLNGKRVQIKGVCNHHDLGPLGAAVNTRGLERQIELLQEMGCNAIRTSHNPPTPELLDLCDDMGMLVLDEAFDTWSHEKRENDYARLFHDWHERDVVALVHRDRNHPSVFMWSSGNEIHEQGDGAAGQKISQMLTDIFPREDPSRPVNVGCNHVEAAFEGFYKTMDVMGINYHDWLYAQFHEEIEPKMPLLGSETSSCVSSRGEYFFPVSENRVEGFFNHQVSSYDLYAPPWACPPDQQFATMDKCPYVIGEFVWTGFDYLGEPTPYNPDMTNLLNFDDPKLQAVMEKELEALGKAQLPSRSSYFGILDLCGFKKDRFYIYQALWRPELPMAHILPHWTWPERLNQVTPVHVYTSGDEAELFLNGKSMGKKIKGQYEYRLRWDDICYVPGELKVVAYKGGKIWAEDIMKTAGSPSRLEVFADRDTLEADGKDLCYVTVTIKDRENVLVPRANNVIRFSITGPARIVAVANGDATSHASFHATEREAYNGMCQVILQSKASDSGKILLSAISCELPDATLEIRTK
jgi:beta-galactosidase